MIFLIGFANIYNFQTQFLLSVILYLKIIPYFCQNLIAMNIKISALTLSLLLLSCKNRIEEIAVSEEAQANTEKAESLRQQENTASSLLQNSGLQNVSNPQLPAVSSEGVMLNPPHGEPYHRCDIPVGAPLPNTNAITQTQLQPVTSGEALPQVSTGEVQVNQQVSSRPKYNEKGEMLNPPHGEPYHGCDIPVGAPLNSKPVANTENQSVATPQPIQQQVTVAPQTGVHTGVTAEGFSGKPNPPHGQPGHRCDIAVGAILP